MNPLKDRTTCALFSNSKPFGTYNESKLLFADSVLSKNYVRFQSNRIIHNWQDKYQCMAISERERLDTMKYG